MLEPLWTNGSNGINRLDGINRVNGTTRQQGPPPMSPAERDAILDEEVKRRTEHGYYLLTRVDHIAVLAREESIGLIKLFVDEDGDLRDD